MKLLTEQEDENAKGKICDTFAITFLVALAKYSGTRLLI
jgi:hypothetical protein